MATEVAAEEAAVAAASARLGEVAVASAVVREVGAAAAGVVMGVKVAVVTAKGVEDVAAAKVAAATETTPVEPRVLRLRSRERGSALRSVTQATPLTSGMKRRCQRPRSAHWPPPRAHRQRAPWPTPRPPYRHDRNAACASACRDVR